MHPQTSLTTVKYLFLDSLYFSFPEKVSKQASSGQREVTKQHSAWIESEVCGETVKR